MKLNPPQKLKEKLNCPICRKDFVPISFGKEKVQITPVHIDKSFKKEVTSPNYHIEAFSKVNQVWTTYCTHCGYVMKFIADILEKGVEGKLHLVDFGERRYADVPIEHPKPAMDYTDYISNQIESIQSKIVNTFNKIQLRSWGDSYKDWLKERIDPFKYIVRFMSQIEELCKTEIAVSTQSSLPEKIKALRLPINLEENLIKLNQIRNRAVHEAYELSEEDEGFIHEVFKKLIFYLVDRQLRLVDFQEFKETLNFSFIDSSLVNKGDIFNYIRAFLGFYIGVYTGVPKIYNEFIIPLSKDLGLE